MCDSLSCDKFRGETAAAQPASQPPSTGQASAFVTVQKTVNTARLRLLSFERHACKLALGWHVGLWIWGVLPSFPN